MGQRQASVNRRYAVDARHAILEAAAAELVDAGVERASLRSISRRVGMSHQALTYYFPDRQAVLTAVAVAGFEQLINKTAEAVAQVPAHAPLGGRVVAVGVTYVQFARGNPALFTLMLSSPQIDATDPEFIAAQRRMWRLLLSTVTSESENGWGAGVEPLALAIMSWTIVHGLATLGDWIPRGIDVPDLLATLNRAIAKRDPLTDS